MLNSSSALYNRCLAWSTRWHNRRWMGMVIRKTSGWFVYGLGSGRTEWKWTP